MRESARSPLREIVQPFADLVRSPRAVMGLNLNYGLEGFFYFGTVIYLGMYFNTYVGLDDVRAGWMVGTLTTGITLSMFFFGGRADRWGVRRTLLVAVALMVVGRIFLSAAPSLGLPGGALLSPTNAVAFLGILVIVLGYGVYQPAAYKAVREFTTPETANMGYAMLYGVMNLGGWLPSFMSPVRERWGVQGAYVFFTASSLVIEKKDVEKVLKDLPVGRLFGIGPKLKELNSVGIFTCSQLAKYPVETLTKRFGVIGERLHEMGLGIDDSPVVPSQEEDNPKSISHSATLDEDTSDVETIRRVLLELSERVSKRMRRGSFYSSRVVLTVRYSDFYTFTKQIDPFDVYQ